MPQLTILEGSTFCIRDDVGDIDRRTHGFYSEDTRFLSVLRMKVNGARPLLLSSGKVEYFSAAFFLRNPLAGGLEQDVVSILRERFVGGAMQDQISIQNQTTQYQKFQAITSDQANVYFNATLIFKVRNTDEKTIKNVAYKFIDSGTFNGQLKINWASKVLKGDIEPGFTIDLAHKDLTLIVEAANAARVPMPVGAAAREAFSAARSRGFGPNDFSAMVDALCDVAGIHKPRLS